MAALPILQANETEQFEYESDKLVSQDDWGDKLVSQDDWGDKLVSQDDWGDKLVSQNGMTSW